MDKIFIIIPTYNRKNYLNKLLTQLENQQGLKNIEIHIVVVVDGSTDGTIEMLKKEFSRVGIVLGNGNWWFTKSLNEGIKYAKRFKPDFILTMNDDTEVNADYLTKLIHCYRAIGKECILGSISVTKNKPHRVVFSGTRIIKWRLKSINYYEPFTVIDLNLLNGFSYSDELPTRGLLIPFSVMEKLKYFDEKFPQYGSDYDFVFRAKKLGINSYICYGAVIYQYEKLTGRGSPILKENIWVYTKQLFNKYSPIYLIKDLRILFRHYKTFFLPITLLKFFIAIYYPFFKYRFFKKI